MNIPTSVVKTITSPLPGVVGVSENHYCFETPNLWYYDRNYFNGNPPKIYSYFVSQAKGLVRVWDPYIHDSESVLFSTLPKSAMLQVLTCEGFNKTTIPKIASFPKALEIYLQSGQIDVRCYNKLFEQNHCFHDRYLFIDDIVYKVGASLGYHCGQSFDSHSILRVDDVIARALLKDRFEALWNNKNTMRQK